ncbi:putative ATP-dependent RNA helicase DDX52 [Halotydeus destructor]|nr:putative ATP-dependent RNA helicase DDX52 [Halotydeus destructor]
MQSNSVFRKLCAGVKFQGSKAKPALNKQQIKEPIICDLPEVEDGQQDTPQPEVDVIGEDIPAPLESFEQMAERYDVPEVVLKNIKEAGYEMPTTIQSHAIPLMMDRREIISSAPTGSGKTLAFLLPLLAELKMPKSVGFRAVVLAPTRELAKQIHREFLWMAAGTGLRVDILKTVEVAKEKFGAKSKLKKDILIATPKRFVQLLEEDPPVISLKSLRWLIIDECDKLFEMGFRDELSTIYKECSKAKRIRRAMFSATFDTKLEQWFNMNLDNVVTLIVGGKNKTAETVQQELLFVGSEEGKLVAIRELIAKGLEAPVLIFVDKIDRAKLLHKELLKDGLNVDCIHSDRAAEKRDRIVQAFRQGKIWFLICTELMGRGIDFKAVNFVINFDFPSSGISYIHRVGRTGRAGRLGRAVTFFTERDSDKLRSIVNVMRRSGCQVADYLLSIRPNKANFKPKKTEKKTPKATPVPVDSD